MHTNARSIILLIDLNSGKISAEPLKPEISEKFLGGRGLAAHFLLEMTERGVDPLGPQNALLFMTGPLAGTIVPGSARFLVASKSPLTGVYGEALAGGYFAHQIKYAGYDGVIILGKSSKPVYIKINNEKVEICEASEIWGLTVLETETLIKKKIGEKYHIACIGPAGEKGILYASIMSDLTHAAGRTGLGAVMGSKNLKAIAVSGSRRVAVADDARLRSAVKDFRQKFMQDPHSLDLKRYGTGSRLDVYNELGILPTKNFKEGVFEFAAEISAVAISEKILLKKKSCPYCPIGCGKVVEVKEGPFGGVIPEYGGPHFETITSFGSLCFNRSMESIAMANQICNAYGLDTISMGNVVAFALECFEQGKIKQGDVGFPLRWGDPEAILRLIWLVLEKRGIGALLCNGVKKAAAELGAEELAVHVKGLEVAMHEPRGKKGLGICYATSPRGAVHTEGWQDTAFMSPNRAPLLGITDAYDRFSLLDKPKPVKIMEDFRSLINSLILCSSTARPSGQEHNLEEMVSIITAVTGMEFTLTKLLMIGERNYNAARLFSVREGISRKDDVLPHRFREPLLRGNSAGKFFDTMEFDNTLSLYYQERGWTRNGIPSTPKLTELGLDEYVKDI